MTLKLYGTHPSTNTQRVALVLVEKKVPFEYVFVDMRKGEHKTPDFLEKHPFGQLPYIDDDGFILYESRAIGHYIAAKYADQGTPNILPVDLKASAIFQQACSVEIWDFQQHAGKAHFEMFVKPLFGLVPDKAVFDQHIASVEKSLDGYERVLRKHRYLAGDTLTLADLFHVPTGVAIEGFGATCLRDEKRPHVARWWKDISSRPSWQVVKDGIKSTA